MTLQDIKNRINKIKEFCEEDPEHAHSLEKALHQDVLRAIAEGIENPAELAKETLKTLKIEYPRW